MRVHELAKKTGVSSKELIAELAKKGSKVKSHMSLIEEDILEAFLNKKTVSKKEELKVKKKTSEKKASSKPTKKEKPAIQSVPEKKKEIFVKVSSEPEVVAEEKSEEEKITEPTKTEKASSEKAVSSAKEIKIRFPITVGDLSSAIGRKIPEVIKELMSIGIFANVNQLLNEEIVYAFAEKIGIKIEKVKDETEDISLLDNEDEVKAVSRPPVVTMMGHVDHGKTSLLDAIRQTNVAAREKGAITQHMGAYGVDIAGKGHVTFLDTPGHEAFTAMRARGANATDIVVLVVAADDGVMPQTIEAIDHAREAGCPIVVAINKSDLQTANPDKVMGALQKLDLMPEEWGGKTICVKVSAKTGEGIDKLLEMLLLEAEILELKANPDRLALGIIIESHVSRGSGPVATVIVQKGTLKQGEMIVSGPFMGRVRSMKNDRGKTVREVGPSYSVEMSGLNGVTEAGDMFYIVKDEQTARKITEKKRLELRERQMRGVEKHMSLENLYEKISKGSFKELKVILKTDNQGSLEALKQSLEKLSTDQCCIHVIHGGVGGINESDVMLAAASDAIIIGFHIKTDAKAQVLGEEQGVDIRLYNIIYEVVENVRQAMEGILEPDLTEIIEGKAKVRQVFESSKVGTIGGSIVIKGKIQRQYRVRLIRNNVVLHDGKLASLKRFKDDIREAAEGYEFGFSLEKYTDLREGDILEAYRIEKTAAKL